MATARREFIKTGAALAAGAGVHLAAPQPSLANQEKSKRPLFVATWKFGKAVCERAVKTAMEGKPMLDAIERGIWVAEMDAGNASVGLGGTPNADGVVELDACIMSGPDHGAGSVAGLRDILHPISVARKVMEETRHVMLVGDGARQFALEQGFSKTELLTDNQRDRWKAWSAAKKKKEEAETVDEDQHDTITLVGVDEEGNLWGGCSTSGMGFKLPGRVGDSPIIGSGLYVDNQVGAAGATGIGENVMRYCASFMIVQFMREGSSPTEACERAIRQIEKSDPKSIGELDINFIALNKAGEHGAAGTSKGFVYAVADPEGGRHEKCPILT